MTYDQWKTTDPNDSRWCDEDEPATCPMTILTSHWNKPIPLRQFDWEAWRDGDEPNDDGQMPVGYGRSEAEAINDLMQQIEE